MSAESDAKCPVLTSPEDTASMYAVRSASASSARLCSLSISMASSVSSLVIDSTLDLPRPTIEAALAMLEWGRVERTLTLSTCAA